MVDAERKGQALMAQGDKSLRSVKGFFGSIFGGSVKTEEAAELYLKAANSFKMAKNWTSAGQAFLRAAALELKSDERHIAASHYVDAGNCFRKVDTAEAVKWYLKAIDFYVDMGRFNIAAKHHITVAELYEANKTDSKKALDHYQQAADYYLGEGSTSSANKCLQKVAWYSVEQHQWDKAAEIYEKLGSACMSVTLLRYSAKDHFFRATLCHLCIGLTEGSRALDQYSAMCPVFETTRESNLLKKLVRACSEESADEFTEALREYETMSRLDPWFNHLTATIRNNIPDAGEYNLR